MAKRTVLITGATGNLGVKLRRHLEALGGYELRLLSLTADGDPTVTEADLSVYDDRWARQFQGVDAVIHLAASAPALSTWDEIIPHNIDAVLNVGHAVVAHGAKRIILASSNWVVAGHRFAEVPLTPDLPPRPVNPYGASKLFAERYGRHLAEHHGISVIALRIGWCQKTPGNRPESMTRWGGWGQRMWLSDRDYCQIMEKAIEAELAGFAVLNAMSDNPGARWDLSETRRLLGYQPADGHTASPGLGTRLKGRIRGLQARLFGDASRISATDFW